MEEEQGRGASVERTSNSSRSGQKHDRHSTSSAGAPASPPSKRRRGPGFVTPNACNECKKRRVKCDGKSPCSRCKSQRNVACIYEVPVRRSKENLRHEIESLRRQQQHSNRVFSALNRPELRAEVLRRLDSGQSIAAISDSLDRIVPSDTAVLSSYARPVDAKSVVIPPALSTYGSAVAGSEGYGSGAANQAATQALMVKRDVERLDANSPWDSSSQSRSTTRLEPREWSSEGPARSLVGIWLQNRDQSGGQDRYPGMDQVLALFDSPEIKVPHSVWTSITNDSALVHHLLALYFCWEYPTFASLSKEHFLRDYLHGRHRYCSPILVNALLALGCRFSTQPQTRADPNDPSTSGDHFFSESLRLLYKETNHHTLTTIQALGIMSIREASCGRDSESWYYAGQSVRLAIEMGLHQLNLDGDEDELAVQGATFWGAFALDNAWSLATGSLPRCSQFLQLPPKPAIIDAIEVSLWMPYTDDAPLQRSCEQPSNVRSVYKCFCELSELVHQCLYVLHSPGRPPSSRDLLNIYTQFLNWYDSIPEALRLGQNFTPAVLFAHMYYHFAILLLFRPLIKLRIIGSAILPRDVCSQAADAIQGLLRSYSQLYTLRRTPCFVPYFLLTSSIMHLAVGAIGTEQTSPPIGSTMVKLSPKIAAAVKQSIADLAEMAPCHHFAQQALNILRFTAKKWNIDVGVPYQGVGDDVEKLVRPSTSSLNFFIPNVSAEDFIRAVSKIPSQYGGADSMEGAAAGKTNADMQCVARAPEEALENALFWPFPKQGRPIFPEGSRLFEAGFALL